MVENKILTPQNIGEYVFIAGNVLGRTCRSFFVLFFADICTILDTPDVTRGV